MITDEQMEEIIARDHDNAIREYLHAAKTNDDTKVHELYEKVSAFDRFEDWRNAIEWFDNSDVWFNHDNVWLYTDSHNVGDEPVEYHMPRALAKVMVRYQQLKDLEHDGHEMAGELASWMSSWLWERFSKWDFRTPSWEIRKEPTLPENKEGVCTKSI